MPPIRMAVARGRPCKLKGPIAEGDFKVLPLGQPANMQHLPMGQESLQGAALGPKRVLGGGAFAWPRGRPE